jgi:hypothetical protein
VSIPHQESPPGLACNAITPVNFNRSLNRAQREVVNLVERLDSECQQQQWASASLRDISYEAVAASPVIGECLLHVSTFATTRVALPTEIEPRLIT